MEWYIYIYIYKSDIHEWLMMVDVYPVYMANISGKKSGVSVYVNQRETSIEIE